MPTRKNPTSTTGSMGGIWRREEGPISSKLKEQIKRETKTTMLLSVAAERQIPISEQTIALEQKKK